MRVVSAYLLAQLGGNASPSASDIESICKAGGVEVDSNNVSKFLKEVEGKSVDELIAAGREKLASMPAGGGGGGGGGGAPAGGGGGDAAPAAEEKKVEEESEDEDMGFDLFD